MAIKGTHIISALVEHKPGVLQRIASLFARRKFNIESITVGGTDNPDIARMTIVSTGDNKVLEQIIKQLNKLPNIIKVSDLERGKAVVRELCIVKVNTPDIKQKTHVIQYADVFRGNIVDVSQKTTSVQIIGDTAKIDAFLTMVRNLGIKEIARTGLTAMQRG